MFELGIQIGLKTLDFFLGVWHWITLGFLAAGLIREFVPSDAILRMIGGSDPKSIIRASILGVLADFFPHSSLQLAISLFHMGASRASMITFLVSTPWLCIIESLILISFTGLDLFLFIVLMTMIVAVLGGLIIGSLEKRGLIESERNIDGKTEPTSEGLADSRDFIDRCLSALNYSYSFLKLSGKWLAIGFLGAGVTQVLFPMEVIRGLLGYSVYSVPLALLIAAVMEITVEASIPIICSLYTLGASPGVVFTLLMGGVVTDITEMGTIATVLGKKTAIATLITFSVLTVVFGYMINLFL